MENTSSLSNTSSQSQAVPPPPQLPAPTEKKSLPVVLILLAFIVGSLIGVIALKMFEEYSTPSTAPSPTKSSTITQLSLPKDAVQIETCEDNKGAMFVEPQNIPQGPIYMVNKGQVIGIEFMLNLSQVMNSGKFDYLPAENVKIDHMKFGYLSEGHAGNPVPHFHADLYTVSKNVEENIKCPPGTSQDMMSMPGMDMASGSAMTPIPTNLEKMMQSAGGTMNMNTISPTIVIMH
jgi:hypothetical protein